MSHLAWCRTTPVARRRQHEPGQIPKTSTRIQHAEKAKAKAARKADRLEAAAEAPDDDTATADPGAVMAKLEALHKAFDDDQINFDDFEEAKQELLSQLQV